MKFIPPNTKYPLKNSVTDIMKLPVSILLTLFITVFYSCEKKENLVDGPPSTSGIVFEKSIGGQLDDIAYESIIHNDELYILGSTKSYGEPNGDHYLIKMDLEGNVLWEKTYGGAAEDLGANLIATNDGNFMLVGATFSQGNGMQDIHLLKINPSGDIIWEKTYGGAFNDSPISIIETSANEFCIAGTTESFGAGSRDIYLVWVDQSGNVIREKSFGGTDIDGSTELMEIENNEIMLYGYTTNFGATSRDLYLMRLSATGDSLWAQRYGGNDYEESQDFVRTPSGDYLIHGHSASTDPIHNMFTVKVAEDGTVIWEKNYGGAMHDGGQAILINEAGNYVLIGRSMSFGNGDRNILMVTTNSEGVQLSQNIIGGSRDDWGQDILDYKGHYYIIGHTNSFNDNMNDVYVVKYKWQ